MDRVRGGTIGGLKERIKKIGVCWYRGREGRREGGRGRIRQKRREREVQTEE